MRLVLVIVSLLFALRADADTIAMLPLDGEQRLEIYSQPVAAELARALRAAGVDVVVVGAKMDVPDSAALIVDGTIKAGKGKQITLSIRVRDPRDGTVLETLPTPTTTLDQIDKAAADLSAKVVPSVKAHLQAIAKARAAAAAEAALGESTPARPTRVAPALPVVLTAVSSTKQVQLAMLRDALNNELPRWSTGHRREAKQLTPDALAEKVATKAVADARAELAIAIDVLTYAADSGKVPMARARVRVRIVDGTEVKFERIVRTDTVVGDRDGKPEELARRTAREVLAIIEPHLRRTIAKWR